jgi:hypothetical protein
MGARPILPLIQAPTLVLHRRGYQFIPIANGRYLAEPIPDARSGREPTADDVAPPRAHELVRNFTFSVQRSCFLV